MTLRKLLLLWNQHCKFKYQQSNNDDENQKEIGENERVSIDSLDLF